MGKSDQYFVRVAIAGDAVMKAARAHMRSLRGLTESGAIEITTDDVDAGELLAHGMDRLESAIKAYEQVVKD